MKKYILYLTESSESQESGLLFPSEIENKYYYGIGNLYISDERLQPKYTLLAILKEERIEVTLSHKQNNFYECSIEKIGKFTFYIEELDKPLQYIGSNTQYKNLTVYYRLRLENTEKAEYCAKNDDFYFTGKSNVID